MQWKELGMLWIYLMIHFLSVGLHLNMDQLQTGPHVACMLDCFPLRSTAASIVCVPFHLRINLSMEASSLRAANKSSIIWWIFNSPDKATERTCCCVARCGEFRNEGSSCCYCSGLRIWGHVQIFPVWRLFITLPRKELIHQYAFVNTTILVVILPIYRTYCITLCTVLWITLVAHSSYNEGVGVAHKITSNQPQFLWWRSKTKPKQAFRSIRNVFKSC